MVNRGNGTHMYVWAAEPEISHGGNCGEEKCEGAAVKLVNMVCKSMWEGLLDRN